MIFAVAATVCAGLFAGAAVYVNAVEHPARLSCGPELAVREFAPSYRRATILQASLALLGTLAGVIAAWKRGDPGLLAASLLLAAVIPFTLVVILPTNKKLLDPGLDAGSGQAVALLERWGRLHAVRSLLGFSSFLLFLWRIRSA